MLALPKLNRVNLYPWERMINIEERHHTNYYKFVNMFTDVKHLKESAVRRRYLDFLLPTPKGRKFNSKNMYLYLFTRSFVRGRDAFSIIFRLIVIALVLMIWLSFPIVSQLLDVCLCTLHYCKCLNFIRNKPMDYGLKFGQYQMSK